jgi:hypothetical protein
MNSLYFWQGIAIGTILALLIILAIVHLAGNANSQKAKAAGDRNFLALQERNSIGRLQYVALRAIAAALSDLVEQEDALDLTRTREERDRLMKIAEVVAKDEHPANGNDEGRSCMCSKCELAREAQSAIGAVVGRAE